MTLKIARPFSLALTALAALGVAAGCDPFPNDSTVGDEGRLEFSYASQCFLDCSLDSAIAVGSTELVTFDGRAEGLSFSSSDGAILGFHHKMDSCSCERSSGSDAEGYGPIPPDGQCAEGFTLTCNVYVEAEAHAEGDAKLEIWDESGALVDRVTVHARIPRSATVKRYENEDWVDSDKVAGTAASEALVGVVFRDAAGNPLLSSQGVSWQSADPKIASVKKQTPWFNWSRGSTAQLSFESAGQTTVSARSGTFEAAIPVVVTE